MGVSSFPRSPQSISIEYVDPRKIVNEYFAGPVLSKDREIVKKGFTQTGYNDNLLISCRYATAPEVESLYRRPPYKYSKDKATEITKAFMQSGKSGDTAFAMMAIFESLSQSSSLMRDF